ncbi:MAG: hypothetical protein H0V07_10055 [Propionibacteriales bacterium]|nr:hypothetical protein [Propionibacteriales bacterium]
MRIERQSTKNMSALFLPGIVLVASAAVFLPGSASGALQLADTGTGRPVTVSGVYSAVHGDSRDARYADQTMYFLESSAQTYRLKTAGELPVRSGAAVTVDGTLSGNTIDVAQARNFRTTAPATAPSIAAAGTKSVLVINVVWRGSTLAASAAQEQRFMFGGDSRSLASYYADVSYGQMTWIGTKTPAYTITDPAGCNLATLANRAEAAAAAGGRNPSSYEAVMINAPKLYCGADGYGEIGGRHTWIENGLWNLDSGYARYLPAHEIGHSFGLHHSHGLECGTVTVSPSCLADPASNNSEYGNAWDVMGSNWPGDGAGGVAWFSAKQEMLLGWLSGSRVRTVSTSDTYSVVPLERSGTTRPQVLVVNTPAHTYYIEYRQPIGQDAFMSAYPASTDRVHISVSASFGTDTGPFALDFMPQSNTVADGFDWNDAPLPMGRSFTDPEKTFTISPVSQNGKSATVDVSFTEPTRWDQSAAAFDGWKVSSDTTGTYRASNVEGNTVRFSFSGTSVRWLTRQGPAQGKASVTIDGANKGVVDTYDSTNTSAAVSFNGLASSSHSIVIKVLGKKNADSSNSRVAVGGFASAANTTHANSAKLRYDAWTGVAASAASGGTYRSSAAAGSTANFAFTGTGVDWLTAKGPGWGKAKVSIDGIDMGTVDLYSPSNRYQAPIAYRGLSARSHTIKVTVLGARNRSATASKVSVDAFVVH